MQVHLTLADIPNVAWCFLTQNLNNFSFQFIYVERSRVMCVYEGGQSCYIEPCVCMCYVVYFYSVCAI